MMASERMFLQSFKIMQRSAHQNARAKTEKISFTPPKKSAGGSEHLPKFSKIEEELADVVIRCMSYAEQNGLNLAGAIIAKMKYHRRT